AGPCRGLPRRGRQVSGGAASGAPELCPLPAPKERKGKFSGRTGAKFGELCKCNRLQVAHWAMVDPFQATDRNGGYNGGATRPFGAAAGALRGAAAAAPDRRAASCRKGDRRPATAHGPRPGPAERQRRAPALTVQVRRQAVASDDERRGRGGVGVQIDGVAGAVGRLEGQIRNTGPDYADC